MDSQIHQFLISLIPNSGIITSKSKLVLTETFQDSIILFLSRPRLSETHNIRSCQDRDFPRPQMR